MTENQILEGLGLIVVLAVGSQLLVEAGCGSRP